MNGFDLVKKPHLRMTRYPRQHDMPWLDVRLTEETMKYLRNTIDMAVHEQENAKETLAGNISKSVYIQDKDNWFYEDVLKGLSEYIYFNNSWSNYFEIEIAKSRPLPKFYLKQFWVNYQKQHEFNPPHNHSGGIGFSFVVFLRIPTHWKEQHALPISANSNSPCASDFMFHLEEGRYTGEAIPLSPEDEGRMLFFPAWLKHQVFPFYECEEERVTISGNIRIKDENGFVENSLEKQEQQLLDMEKQVAALKILIQNEKNKTMQH